LEPVTHGNPPESNTIMCTPKNLSGRSMSLESETGKVTANIPNMCQSCKRANNPDNSYCIYCGSILNPVFCSSCGTANPANLGQCLECGATIPDLNVVRWNPIVTVVQPTSAMLNHSDNEPNRTEPDQSLLARLRAKLGHRAG